MITLIVLIGSTLGPSTPMYSVTTLALEQWNILCKVGSPISSAADILGWHLAQTQHTREQSIQVSNSWWLSKCSI